MKRGWIRSKPTVGVDMFDWQPIDTVPVDCSDILVWCDEREICMTVWVEANGSICDVRTGDELDPDGISFWMPLPESPAC